MPGNARFYDQVHYIKARYDSFCPECKGKIDKDSDIVYMSEFKTALHQACFIKPSPIVNNFPMKKKKMKESCFINLNAKPSKETEIFQYRIKNLSVLNRKRK